MQLSEELAVVIRGVSQPVGGTFVLTPHLRTFRACAMPENRIQDRVFATAACNNLAMAVEVVLGEDPGWALTEAGVFLASDPVLHNLILTLLQERLAYPEPGRYWLAKDGDIVVGVAFQSPLDFAATLTPMRSEVVAAVVDAIVEAGVTLPGVIGEAATAARFAGQWTER